MFTNEPAVLVDGLQRFATGTSLLALLYDRVLSPQPTNPAAAAHFVRLHAHVQHLQPVYIHNHNRFWNHSRRAISKPYRSLCREMERLIGSLLEPNRVVAEATKINVAMLDKQIAVDEYWNFRSDVELANTFIGLNTVRVELGPVDLIRAYVVDAATAQNWSPQDVARVENDITERFTRDGKTKPELVPTATVILKCLQSRDGLSPNRIFPNWPAITSGEVDLLLDFVERMVAAADRRTGTNNYLREIRECGYLPFALAILFYYRQLIQHGTLPPFLGGPTPAASDADLHSLLRAAYRILLDGRVGRIGDIADGVARDAYATLPLVADDVAATTSSGPLGGTPAPDWLRANLTDLDRGKARRAFNACLLPDRVQPGGPFTPLVFGRGASEWQVDHLIPDANLQANQAGYPEGESLRNFAPLPQPVNRGNANTPCSQKLAPGGADPTYWFNY